VLPNRYLGGWGNLGSQTQKGVTTYAVSANRQKPLAGALHNAIFNTFRRTRHQILYWLTPMVIAYGTMQWAMEKYVFDVWGM
jgi:ubiquinol-cytochrome c reductase subunit 8